MTVTISGTDGITTPGLTNTGTETLVNLTTTGNTTLGDASTDTLNVGNGGLVKDASGNVGVGVTPSAWGSPLKPAIELPNGVFITSYNGAALSAYFGCNSYYNGTNYVYKTNGYATLYAHGSSGSHAWNIAASGTAGNAISFTQAMTLDASGNLGIGTSSPYSAITLGKAGGSQYISAVDNTTGYQIGYLQFNSDNITLNAQGGAGGTSNFIRILTGGSEKARIDSSGNMGIGVTSSGAALEIKRNTGNVAYFYNNAGTGVALSAGNNAWSSISDERVKDIIEPITNATEKVSTLRAVIGKYKSDEEDRRRSFLIAQDVQAVFPEAVSPWKLPDDETEYLGVQYTDVIPLLVAAIQEQQALITALTDRITALENK